MEQNGKLCEHDERILFKIRELIKQMSDEGRKKRYRVRFGYETLMLTVDTYQEKHHG